MNLAGVHRLPVVFICDNNQYAYSTPNRLEFGVDHLAERAASYGFEGVVVDGTDVLTVYREAHTAIERAREGGGPTLLELVTLRMEGHAVHDDAFYVPRELLEAYAKKDPIERYRRWLKEQGVLDEARDDEINVEVKRLLNDAMKRAEQSPLPEPGDLHTGVYAEPEELDTPHHR
jgi:TPP-dependent pyruvate/acetoin dehydrogenase alpha subunit